MIGGEKSKTMIGGEQKSKITRQTLAAMMSLSEDTRHQKKPVFQDDGENEDEHEEHPTDSAEMVHAAASEITTPRGSKTKRMLDPPTGSSQESVGLEEDSSIASDDTEEVNHVSPRDSPPNEHSGNTPQINGSLTALRSFRRLRASRKRVPGGAAAKLIGRTNEEEIPDKCNVDDGDDTVEVVPPTDEFIKLRDQAKEEFTNGTKNNRRYHAPEGPDMNDITEEQMKARKRGTIPSSIKRNEIFHENAQAAVISLLGPHASLSLGPQSNTINLGGNSKNQNPGSFLLPPVSVFKAPPRKEEESVQSMGSGPGPGGIELETTTMGKNPLEQPLLTTRAQKRVEQMEKWMKDPNKTLADLMAAIASPKDGQFTRGYMVRRKNACGALQVLTAKNVHRVQICWTLGVLPALSSVLEDSGNRSLEEEFTDAPTRREFEEARKRAVSSLMNLAMAPENRLAIFHSPRLIPNIVRIINLDDGEARRGCCAVLAHLAKSRENRVLMAQVPGLVDAITGVIELQPLRFDIVSKGEDSDDDDSSESSHDDEEGEEVSKIPTCQASVGTPEIAESFMSKDEKIDVDAKPTIEVSAIPSEDQAVASKRYDGDPNGALHGARQNIFALLGHLVKEKDNAFVLARQKYLIDTLVTISKLHDTPNHEHAVKLLAHLTRHRGNSKHIVFKLQNVVPALVKASFSVNDETRKYACFALQNLSQDKPCRQELAVTENLLSALCVRIRQASDPEERIAALHTMKNLTDEPANLIPMTNTPECFATLMQIAHASDDSVTDMMQYLGCDALATLSHWFRSIATSGQRIDYMKRGEEPPKDLFVPSLKIVTWEQWQ